MWDAKPLAYPLSLEQGHGRRAAGLDVVFQGKEVNLVVPGMLSTNKNYGGNK